MREWDEVDRGKWTGFDRPIFVDVLCAHDARDRFRPGPRPRRGALPRAVRRDPALDPRDAPRWRAVRLRSPGRAGRGAVAAFLPPAGPPRSRAGHGSP